MDTSFLKSDIFFVVTTVSMLFITVFVIVGLLYLISILNSVRHVAKIAKEQAAAISEDVTDLREEIRNKGASLSGIAGFLSKITKRRTSSKKK